MASQDNKHQSLSSVRLLKIIECMADKTEPMRLTDLAAELAMTQPTLLRYLNALYTEGYIYQDMATGNYALTWKICGLGERLRSNVSLRTMVSPYLAKLSRALDVGLLLAVEHEGDILYLDMVGNPNNSMGALLRIGKDAPIHTTGSGKIMLSSLPNAQVLRILEAKGMPALTRYTITDQAAFMEELAKVREQGYALDNEEYEIGHKCLSVPVRDFSGRIAAAISAFDDADRLTEERMTKKILPALREAAGEISYRLGYTPFCGER